MGLSPDNPFSFDQKDVLNRLYIQRYFLPLKLNTGMSKSW